MKNTPFIIFLLIYSPVWLFFIFGMIVELFGIGETWPILDENQVDLHLSKEQFKIVLIFLATAGLGFIGIEVFLLSTKRSIKRTSAAPLFIEIAMWVPVLLLILLLWLLSGLLDGWGPS